MPDHGNRKQSGYRRPGSRRGRGYRQPVLRTSGRIAALVLFMLFALR